MRIKRIPAAFCLLFLVLVLPFTASAASSKGMSFDKYLKKGKNYTVLVYNSTQGAVAVYGSKNLKAKAICWLNYGDTLVVDKSRLKKKKRYQWIPVKVQSPGSRYRTGYLYAKKVTAKKIKPFALKTSRFSSNRIIDRAVKYGMKYLGTPFLLGGKSVTGGIDCSNFVVQCFAQAGKQTSYPHTDSLQAVSYPVSRSQLKPGDLIFYRDADPCMGPIGHVAIYIGNGFVLHASGHYGHSYPGGGVCIKRINYGRRIAAMYKRLYGF